jgi:hypothetical protein
MLLALGNLGFKKKEPAEKANPAETRHPVSKLPKPCQILQAVGFQILQKVLLLALIQVAVSLAGWAHFAEEVDRGHEGESYAVKHAT